MPTSVSDPNLAPRPWKLDRLLPTNRYPLVLEYYHEDFLLLILYVFGFFEA